jgi:uncharacterized repeat protein (TIGR01451 family)
MTASRSGSSNFVSRWLMRGGMVVVMLALLVTVGLASNIVQASLIEIEKLIPSDGADRDEFGCAVSISGDTIVVGANLDDDKGTDSGSAYVFSRNQGGTDNWGLVKKLTASDGAGDDHFGYWVCIDNDTIIVAAYGDTDKGPRTGAAYIYYRNQGGTDNWGQVKKLTSADGASYDYFGWGVCVNGDTIAVGAPGDGDKGSNSGSTYVYYRNQGGADNWGQIKKLTASDGEEYDSFGISVSIDADALVAGAYMDDDKGYNSGAAYVFSRNQGGADNWGEVKKLTPSDGEDYDFMGYCVSISGDTVVAGADGDDEKGVAAGAAYVFSRDQGGSDNWGEVKKLTAFDGAARDHFGISVSVNGDIIAVGSYGDNAKGNQSGSAYAFSRNQDGADNWGLVKKLVASDGEAFDSFGRSVSVDEKMIAVGAYWDFVDEKMSGSAYLFEDVVLKADLSITKTGDARAVVGTRFNYMIDVTNNGPYDATGIVVTDILPAGATYHESTASQGIYNNATGIWTVGSLISGETASLNIEVNANALPNTTLANTAEVTGNEIDPVSDNNSASLNTTVITAVGGEVSGVNKLEMLAPWLALGLVLTIIILWL